MYGCQAVLKLDALSSHLSECEHNPKKPVPCEQGCGLIIPMDELKVWILKRFLLIIFIERTKKISTMIVGPQLCERIESINS